MKKYAAILFVAVLLASVRATADEASARAACPEGSEWSTQEHGRASGCFDGARGLRLGEWFWKNKDGMTISSLSYNEAGVAEGQAMSWWPEDGHIKEQVTYKAGKLHGLRRRWAYQPGTRSWCKREVESCWAGSQECWIRGERRPHGECADMYAGRDPGTSRSIASKP